MNSVLHLTVVTKWSNVACAMAICKVNVGAKKRRKYQHTPSKVDVPRPSSSRMTKLRDVAVLRISLVSVISTMNVDRPLAISSDAATLIE